MNAVNALPTRLLVTGLSGHGKSTYLAALWCRIRDAKADASVRLRGLPDDAKYLNELADSWLKCEPVAHTTAAAVQSVNLPIACHGADLDLTIPDYSGEFITRGWADRLWTHELDAFVKASRGVLLFVHPLHVQDALTIEECNRNAAALEAELPSATLQASEYKPESSPTQVQLVDFLQGVHWRSSGSRAVAVIVSAWDVVSEDRLEPGAWLSQRLPLLNQYLLSNPDLYPFKVFGVSAQGGPLPGAADKLLKMEPADRTTVATSGAAPSHDITVPLGWLVERRG
jgi:hypothetical protein